MKRLIAKILLCAVCFVSALFIISGIQSRGNTDMTQDMSSASLPIAYVRLDDRLVNPMHGHRTALDLSSVHESITPLSENRTVQIEIERYGLRVKQVRMEVRSRDGLRLIQSSEIEEMSVLDDRTSFQIEVKDLIDENQEYNLILILTLEDDRECYYYTRILYAPEYHSLEKLTFAENFSTKTFDKEQVNDLKRYMETSAKGDDTSFGRVTIHSSIEQLGYGQLNIHPYTNPVFTISELARQTASVKISYLASIREENKIDYYMVNEFYRLRYTVERIYLLDYERTMSRVISPEDKGIYKEGVFHLGIQAEEPELVESESGNVFAFENCGRVYSYNASENKLAELFAFYHDSDRDERTLYDAHHTEVLSVDETGNVFFVVYGYMNCGLHEGEIGLCVYEYNSLTNALEEQVFIPYEKTYEILRAQMQTLSYLSKSNIYYFILDGNIYGVDLASREVHVFAQRVGEEGFKISEDQSNLVWQVGPDVNHSTKLILMNLNTQVETEIVGEAGQYIKPIGFMGNDLIYGVAYPDDVYTDSTGITTFGMCRLRIQDDKGTLLKEYEVEDVYVTDASIVGNQLLLKRAKKAKDGISYVEIADDQILSQVAVTTTTNEISYQIDALYEKQLLIKAVKDVGSKNYMVLTPRYVIYEGEREATLAPNEAYAPYYVYAKDGVIGVTEKPATAVMLANENAGVVIDDTGDYVWMKGNRATRNQIMAIKAAQASEERSSIAVCLDTMLAYENVIRNSQYLLDEGQTVMSILQENIENATVLDLSGCTLDSILYYIDRDIPVLALTDEEAYLITGFNESQIVLMDPMAEGLYKKGIQDMADYFTANGAVFLTYLVK